MTGDVHIKTGNRVYNGNIVNLSESGCSVRLNDSIEFGCNVQAVLMLQEYPEEIKLAGQVGVVKNGLASIKFLSSNSRMQTLIKWLEIENYPWTANLVGTSKSNINSLGNSPEALNQSERDDLRDHLHSLG